MPSHSNYASAEVASHPTLPSYSAPSQPPAYAARSPLTSPPPPTVPQNTPTKAFWGAAATPVVSQGPILWRAKDTKQGTAEEETTVWNGNATEEKKQSIWSSKGTSQGASLWGDRLRGDSSNVWGGNV